jgi:hypothetical protein
MEIIFIPPAQLCLDRSSCLEVGIERYIQKMADEIEKGVAVALVFKGIIGLQDRGLAEIGLESPQEMQRKIIEIGVIGTIESSLAENREIECGLLVDSMEIVQAGVMEIIGKAWIVIKIGIIAFGEKRNLGKILVKIEIQGGQLVSFRISVLKDVVRHVLVE